MKAIMQRRGIQEFEAFRELEPGFLLGMKAGGSGGDVTLLTAVPELRQATALGHGVS